MSVAPIGFGMAAVAATMVEMMDQMVPELIVEVLVAVILMTQTLQTKDLQALEAEVQT